MLSKDFIYEYIIDFVEMFISCYLASRIFEKRNSVRWRALLLFALAGSALQIMNEAEWIRIPDFLPSIILFFLFSMFICHASLWSSILWAVLNYFMMGAIAAVEFAIFGILLGVSTKEIVLSSYEYRGIVLTVAKLAQLFLSEFIIRIRNWLRKSSFARGRGDMAILAAPFFSCLLLLFLRYAEYHWSQDAIYYFNLLASLLLLIGNFSLLFFRAVLFKEKDEKVVLQEHGRLLEMQIKNQSDLGEIYDSMRILRHDMNNHMHTILGYIQTEKYDEAKGYIEKIVGEMEGLETFHTGNTVLDTLLGSKAVLARKSGIKVETLAAVPTGLKISEKHLTSIVGNLYDNAMEASMKIEDVAERYIRIVIFYQEGNLLITFANAAREESERDGDKWLTTKSDIVMHGFGMKSIDRIVEEYEGYCRRELKNGEFVCQIRLPDIVVQE